MTRTCQITGAKGGLTGLTRLTSPTQLALHSAFGEGGSNPVRPNPTQSDQIRALSTPHSTLAP
jgi:hypothetical protein